MSFDALRLARLTLPGKFLVTLFVLIVGPGYLFGTLNIMLKHQDADEEEGLTLDDLRATFHGMEKVYTPEAEVTVNSTMLEQVRPGGDMREHLEDEPAIHGLIAWLENGAKEEEFDKGDLAQAGDPSAKAILASSCIECHNSDGGDMEDAPFASAADAEPEYAMVMETETTTPEYERHEVGPQTKFLAPTGEKRLVHITHVHVLAMPVFTMIVGMLFLMTGFGSGIKLLIGPLPMLAVMADISSWWLARYSEPFIFVIAASGAVFGLTYALQILCILGSTWCGKKCDPSP